MEPSEITPVLAARRAIADTERELEHRRAELALAAAAAHNAGHTALDIAQRVGVQEATVRTWLRIGHGILHAERIRTETARAGQ